MDERLDVLEWLSKVRYRDHHDFAKKDRFHGTGKWLLQRDAFDKWLKVESSILWVNGKRTYSFGPSSNLRLQYCCICVAGAGKTVLA